MEKDCQTPQLNEDAACLWSRVSKSGFFKLTFLPIMYDRIYDRCMFQLLTGLLASTAQQSISEYHLLADSRR